MSKRLHREQTRRFVNQIKLTEIKTWPSGSVGAASSHTPEGCSLIIPSQGTYLGCGFDPCQGMYKRQPLDVSISHPCFSENQ